MTIQEVPLKNYSSLKVGGTGQLVTVTITAELVEALMYACQKNLRVHILGEGTNTFFGDTMNDLLVIKLELRGISLRQEGSDFFLTAFAGENWDDLVTFAVNKGLWGIENLSYIPGTVGAAPVQNIGAYGMELKDSLVSLEAIDMDTFDQVEISNEACQFGYRDSLFKHKKNKYCIISVTLKLSSQSHPRLEYKPLDTLASKENATLQEIRDLVIATRKAKLPDYKVYPNTGSFFKNPLVTKEKKELLEVTFPDMPFIVHGDNYKIPAAWLIERVAAMKGIREGNVGTWPHQPLVVVNYGTSTADELRNFTENIIKKIADKTEVTLEREVNFVE
jgi:UDP-N-acetylmuramate dehydrogenase